MSSRAGTNPDRKCGTRHPQFRILSNENKNNNQLQSKSEYGRIHNCHLAFSTNEIIIFHSMTGFINM